MESVADAATISSSLGRRIRGPQEAIPLGWIKTHPGAAKSDRGFDLAAVLEDEWAFRGWYEEAAPRVYAYLFTRTGSITTAEELTQETFIEVMRSPGSYDGRSDPLPWLLGVARHRLSRRFRQSRREDNRWHQLVKEIAVAGRENRPWDEMERRDSVGVALDALPRDQRLALVLRFADDLTVREVARTMGRSTDATESLVRRALSAFETAYMEVDRDA